MPSNEIIKKVIKASELSPGKVLENNGVFIHSKFTLLKGVVLGEDGLPVKNVAVKITQVKTAKTSQIKETELGVVFSDENGVYAMPVEVCDDCKYRIEYY